jgi:hypothetical protein
MWNERGMGIGLEDGRKRLGRGFGRKGKGEGL